MLPVAYQTGSGAFGLYPDCYTSGGSCAYPLGNVADSNINTMAHTSKAVDPYMQLALDAPLDGIFTIMLQVRQRSAFGGRTTACLPALGVQ